MENLIYKLFSRVFVYLYLVITQLTEFELHHMSIDQEYSRFVPFKYTFLLFYFVFHIHSGIYTTLEHYLFLPVIFTL